MLLTGFPHAWPPGARSSVATQMVADLKAYNNELTVKVSAGAFTPSWLL